MDSNGDYYDRLVIKKSFFEGARPDPTAAETCTAIVKAMYGDMPGLVGVEWSK